MMPMPSIEDSAAQSPPDEHGEIRQQKPKTLPCKYCSKRFRRVEHVQRHERTHTKEKPFHCLWARCGKTFGRRDLLVRHEKLVHLNEGGKDGSRPRKLSSGNAQSGPPENHVEPEIVGYQQRVSQQHYVPDMNAAVGPSMTADPRLPQRAVPACNLDLLSDAATHLATAGDVNTMQPMIADLSQPPNDPVRVKAYDESVAYNDRGREPESSMMHAPYPAQPPPQTFDDYHLFLDDFASSSHFLPPPLDAEQPFGSWSRMPGSMKPAPSFPSTRFSSLQPDMRDVTEGASRFHDEVMRAPMWRISTGDHTAIKNKLDEFSSVLPNDFVFPSRHTLSRFLEGYISGFHEQLPFLHIPTLNPLEMSPELLLAILAVGAQYRFESHRGHALWYAARAVALEQIKRRHSHELRGLLPTPAAYSPHSTRPSPSSGLRHSFTSVQQDRPMTQETHKEPYSPNTPQARLETIQTLLLLFAVGIWGAKVILQESLALQSQLALLIREEPLVPVSTQGLDWETWIRVESSTRTKLITYCFFNLCSISYNTPPLLFTSEMNLLLPSPSRLWRAEAAWQWQDIRQSYPHIELLFQDAFSRLVSRPTQGVIDARSALGNYVLIHALIQHIYLLKQTSFVVVSQFEVHRGLKVEDIEEVSQALRVWQVGFEQHRQIQASEAGQQGPAEIFSGGPVAFNSTALLRLAYIRLFTDLSPNQTLESRDPMAIAQSFVDAPLLSRNPRLHRAILQAIHALSMLVKVGINYVARTKSLEWSMQHSLCNLECAVLLSKWLMSLASINPGEPPVTPEERQILEMVRRMLDETEFAVPIDPSLSDSNSGAQARMSFSANDGTKLRQLACAVIRLWAETFKGTHIFDLVKVMAQGLEGYADLVEKPGDRTPLARIAANPGMS